MAGEAVLSGFLKAVFEKLSSPVLEEFGLLWAFNKELVKLRSTASTIQAVLVDAERQQLRDEAVKDWIEKLKYAAYDVEDIFDDLETEALQRKAATQEHKRYRDWLFDELHGFFSPSNVLVFRYEMAHKIKKIQERLDAIAAERSNFHFKEGAIEFRTGETACQQTPTHSFVNKSEICGRDADKARIVEMLIKGSDEEDASVIPIVGMGGLGKTTLAQLAYNDEQVEKHFELRMWVCVSLDFNVQRLTKEILESAMKGKCKLPSMDLQQSRLREILNGKRFLLVLDDVWNEEPEKWNSLKNLLQATVGGCRIIATTRSEKAALLMSTHQSYHHLSLLSEDDSWSLFKRHAYQPGQEQQHPNLVLLGKDIVKKCQGLPLAVKALGSLMFFKKEEREWLSIRDSEIWNSGEDEKEILPALRLSYDNLSSRLKRCFAYCSIFPKGRSIEKDKLIKLWMAEGFLQPSMTTQSMEEMGAQCFVDLVQRSLFQEAKKGNDGSISQFKMHDLIHNLAATVAGIGCSVLNNSKAISIHQMTRHSSLSRKNGALASKVEALQKARKLRTLLLHGYLMHKPHVNVNVCLSFGRLRVLDLSDTRITNLPASIGNLKQLRYLDLSRTWIETFPNSICKLQNLQTLKLLRCEHLKELPENMRKMVNLRHVEMDALWSSEITCMPAGIGQLSCLQTLPMFIVGKETGRRIEELKQLDLHGHLQIRELQNLTNSSDACEANLKEKQSLRSLTLSWKEPSRRDNSIESSFWQQECVVGNLEPCSGLKILSIEYYMGTRLPGWMMDSLLPNLVEISLIECRRCEHLPRLNQLPFLKVLTLAGLDAIRFIEPTGSAPEGGNNAAVRFPMLEVLSLWNMCKLEGWSRQAEEGQEIEHLFPCLRKLSIGFCPKLLNFPTLPQTLKSLSLSSSNEMLLRQLVESSTSLSSVCMRNFPEMTSLPEGFPESHILLKYLEICDCPKLKSLEIENHATLELLLIENCGEMAILPGKSQSITSLETLNVSGHQNLRTLTEGLQSLTRLEDLMIMDCQELPFLLQHGMHNLTSLHTLEIYESPELTSLPGSVKYLSALKYLYIWHCTKLSSWPEEGMQHLTSLSSLSIERCPELSSLPEALWHFTALNDLDISECPKLLVLPESIGNLKSLERLTINDCTSIICLPTQLQQLTQLQFVKITKCPLLERRCKKGQGKDWYKIAHVPEVQIGGLQPKKRKGYLRRRQWRLMHLCDASIEAD